MDTAARKQCDALFADEPARRLGDVSRVGVLGDEKHEAAPELVVQRSYDERERRLGDACAGRQRLREGAQAVTRRELADEREQGGTLNGRSVHGERRNGAFRECHGRCVNGRRASTKPGRLR